MHATSDPAVLLHSAEGVATITLNRGSRRNTLSPELIAELADWFPRHTAHLDSALAHWMSKKNFGGKPVVLRRS